MQAVARCSVLLPLIAAVLFSMAIFYEKLLKEGMSPAASLREAQVEMSKSKQWAIPIIGQRSYSKVSGDKDTH